MKVRRKSVRWEGGQMKRKKGWREEAAAREKKREGGSYIRERKSVRERGGRVGRAKQHSLFAALWHREPTFPSRMHAHTH